MVEEVGPLVGEFICLYMLLACCWLRLRSMVTSNHLYVSNSWLSSLYLCPYAHAHVCRIPPHEEPGFWSTVL